MTNYCLPPGVRWSVGRTNLTVTDGRGSVRVLGYPEAAVWDLCSRGYAFDAVVDLMQHIGAMPRGDAAALVRRTLAGWRAAGLLEER